MPPITDISQLDLNKRYTYADYLTWQFSEWVELIRGKVRLMSPAPRRTHQKIAGQLFGTIFQHLRTQRCEVYHARFDVRLTRSTPNGDTQITTVVQPDICVICDPRKLDEQGCLGSPDWIIEIVAPGNVAHDTKSKFVLYEENGVAEYWIVFPGEKSVAVYLLQDGQYQLRGEYYQPGLIPSATLPEVAVTWEDAFEGV